LVLFNFQKEVDGMSNLKELMAEFKINNDALSIKYAELNQQFLRNINALLANTGALNSIYFQDQQEYDDNNYYQVKEITQMKFKVGDNEYEFWFNNYESIVDRNDAESVLAVMRAIFPEYATLTEDEFESMDKIDDVFKDYYFIVNELQEFMCNSALYLGYGLDENWYTIEELHELTSL
jgi:hypothetical protein